MESNTHICRGKISHKIPQTTAGGTDFILLVLAVDAKNKIAIECWTDVRDALDDIPVGSAVEVHSWASSREWQGKYYTSLKARSVKLIGAKERVRSDEIPLPEPQDDDINF